LEFPRKTKKKRMKSLGFFFVVLCLISLVIAEKKQPLRSNPTTISEILDSCYSYLESHLCEGRKWGKSFHFYRPSIEKYSADQFLWDSGSHMIVWSHRNVTNSILDLRTMLQFQQANGMIPEEIFWQERSPIDDLLLRLEYSNTQHTDITQMPVLPFSLKTIYQASNKNRLVLKEFLYPLVNYFHWWRNTRDTGDGLVFTIHNWESGIDASPAYDPAFHTYVTALNETAFRSLYPRFIEVIETYNLLYKWNMTEILARNGSENSMNHLQTWFKMKDIAVNCVYAAGWRILGQLSLELGDTTIAEECQKQYQLTEKAIITKMWNKEQGHYNSLYIDNDGIEKSSIANTVQNLFPLLLSDLPEDHLTVILSHLKDEQKFNSKYMIPTVAMDDPQFSATFDVDLMWRGPVWGFTNWFVMEGLGLHQQFDLQVWMSLFLFTFSLSFFFSFVLFLETNLR
jgi:hypothetical protein